MRSRLPGLVMLLLGGLAGHTFATADDAPLVPIGVARVDITPDYPVRLGGYLARDKPTTKVAQRLWAKALAIGGDDQGLSVLVSVDNLGVGRDVVEDVARRLKTRVRLPRERFVVASSHTHSAPCTTTVAPHIFGKKLADDEQAAVDRYTRELADHLEKVSLAAIAARKPAKMAWAQGSVDFAMNRRTRGGPVDHAMPVLRVTDADDKLVAVVVNYACHCTTLDPRDNAFSGDWASFTQEAIEADHPGAIALTVVGCGADSNPKNRLAPGAAEAHGRAMANELKRLLAGPWTPLDGAPEARFDAFTLPFDTLPTRAELEKLVKAGGPPGYNASVQLARLDRGEPLQSQLDYSAQAWRFGDDLLMVFLPGEVVVDYVLRLKKEFDPGRIWVTAYANDVPCYIPSERILREGGYEGGGAMVYYARPTRLRPGVEQIILDGVHRVVGDHFAPRAGEAAADDMPPPKTPAEAIAAFRVKPGLKVELAVAEPLVLDPVAIDFGADGYLWVCEMRDYPTGIDGQWKPGGIVRRLEDRDSDGRYDTAVEFLGDLPFPTGVMAWRKGVLVCAAPDIIYAEDTNGDGKADVRKVLFHGFATENYQARVNGLSYGLDNWVYGANGLIGGNIRGTATGREVNIGGRDFRINPDTGVMEPASGLTQQGRVRDDWGNQFGGNNSILIQHYPFPDHYARRNPRVAAPSPAVLLTKDADPSLLYPASETLARYNHPESANRVTSACSPLIYRDDVLGPEYVGNALTCEPVHNLVRRSVLTPDGVTFAGHRAADEQTSEFFASTDPWFRPVQVRTGPDGALWVVDMYRFVIEHPRWISPEKLATLDVRAGADKGRIYRIVSEKRAPRTVARLSTLSTADLAAALDTANGTVRDNVQRLLVERADRAAAPMVQRLAAESQIPAVRAQALGTLDGLKSLEAAVVRRALDDPHPGVRREAVRLAEGWLDRDADIRERVSALASDSEPTVRFQVALGLGASAMDEVGTTLGRIAVKDASDPWIRAAVLSSATHHAARILGTVVASADEKGPKPALMEPLVATLAGSRDPASIARALEAITGAPAAGPKSAPWRMGAMAELLDAVSDPKILGDAAVREMLATAREQASATKARPSVRIAALRLLGRVAAERDADRATLAERLDPVEPSEIQLAAVRSLARFDDVATHTAVVARWARLAPAVRSALLDAWLARVASTKQLLASIEGGAIAPAEIDATHRQILMGSKDPAIVKRAAVAFKALEIGPRQAVLNAYTSARTLPGDPERGKAVFTRICAACHKLAGLGNEVGPDLAALTDTTAEALSIAILDPNRDVDARYASYTAALKDGRVLTGLIASETASAIALKRQEGQGDVILRADLDELTTAGKSLMPEGLENDLKPAELADVMAFVARGANRPKSLEGNRPELVVQNGKGIVRLPASAAEVYGPNLIYETATNNLGYWHAADDRAAWTFRVDQPATFTVTMEWACAEESAGNPFMILVDRTPIHGSTGGTGKGTWANYRSIFLAEVTLTPGNHRLDFRPARAPQGALMDLRAVVLTPRSEGVYRKSPATPAR